MLIYSAWCDTLGSKWKSFTYVYMYTWTDPDKRRLNQCSVHVRGALSSTLWTLRRHAISPTRKMPTIRKIGYYTTLSVLLIFLIRACFPLLVFIQETLSTWSLVTALCLGLALILIPWPRGTVSPEDKAVLITGKYSSWGANIEPLDSLWLIKNLF